MTDTAMAETSPESKHPQAKTRRLARSIVLWMPIAISLVSLGFSAGTYFLYQHQVKEDQRRSVEEQHRIAVESTANVSVMQDADDSQPLNGLQIMNDGPAVARLKSITYYVDRKPVDSADDVIDFGKLQDVGTFQFNDNDTLAAGGREWLLSMSTKVKPKGLDNFNDFLEHHVAVEVEVCSDVTGKCQTQCSQENWCK